MHRSLIHNLCAAAGGIALGLAGPARAAREPLPELPDAQDYRLVFQDEFEGASLDWTVWDSEDAVKTSASGQRTYRSRANVMVADGLLKLMVRKEKVPGAEWTAAFVWLRETFGPNTYYESRFINTDATGINNAFWLTCKTAAATPYANRYEIDCPENKLHTDGTIHAHLAWHDWKTCGYLGGQHIAQGFGTELDDKGFQTWGVWVGEQAFTIYYNGKEMWDGTTHAKYHDQYCSGVGKFPSWHPKEEKRAYGRHGQDDWCYFGGMNGDAMNAAFSTIPWYGNGTPLTDRAHGAFMGVDYLRVYKRKQDFNTVPWQETQEAVTPGREVPLSRPFNLARTGNSYFSFRVRKRTPAAVSLSLLAEGKPVSTMTLTQGGTLEIRRGRAVASSATSYPASDRLGSSVRVGPSYLVVGRMTGAVDEKDLVSYRVFAPGEPVPANEPFLYWNLDDGGNTGITTQWDLSQKIDSTAAVTALRFDYQPSRATCDKLTVAANYLAVVVAYLNQGVPTP